MIIWYMNREDLERDMTVDQPPRMRYAVYSTTDFKKATFVSSCQIKDFAEKAFFMMYGSEADLADAPEHFILIDWTPGEPEIDWPGARAIAKAFEKDPTLPLVSEELPIAAAPDDMPLPPAKPVVIPYTRKLVYAAIRAAIASNLIDYLN